MNANSRAFPVGIAASEIAPEYLQEGMSLRDYFAAKAMHESNWKHNSPEHNLTCANFAYEIADAMMKAREI